MVVPGDVACVVVDAAVLQLGDTVQNGHALGGVALHDLVFLGGEGAGLGQHRVGYGDLANVVEDGGQSDVLDLILPQSAAKLRAVQQYPGDLADALDVASGLLVAELNGGGQGLDHPLVELNDLLRLLQQGGPLVLHNGTQVLPGLKQLDHRLDAPQNHIGDHRLLDHVHHAQLIGLPHDILTALGGNEEHGDFVQKLPLLHPPQYFQSRHLRHQHVQEDGAEPPAVLQEAGGPDAAVLRLLYGVKGRKNLS